MHFVPFATYVICDECAHERLVLFARHPDPEPGAAPRHRTRPPVEQDAPDAFIDGEYKELAREYLEDANRRRHRKRRAIRQSEGEPADRDPPPAHRTAAEDSQAGTPAGESVPRAEQDSPSTVTQPPGESSKDESAKTGADSTPPQRVADAPLHHTPTDSASDTVRGELEGSLRELRRRRAETSARLKSIRQDIGDLNS